MRGIAFVLLFGWSLGAHAQPAPPPIQVPQLPDEPLPEWHPPSKRAQVTFLELTPQMLEAQKLRQTGLWVSSTGWALLFGAGILYVWAANVNNDISSPADTPNLVFQPDVEDKRNRIVQSAATFFAIGGAMAVGGFVVYTVGQWRLVAHHKSHPKDPLPPLSGF